MLPKSGFLEPEGEGQRPWSCVLSCLACLTFPECICLRTSSTLGEVQYDFVVGPGYKVSCTLKGSRDGRSVGLDDADAVRLCGVDVVVGYGSRRLLFNLVRAGSVEDPTVACYRTRILVVFRGR